MSQIPKYVPSKYKARIESWDDERSLGNSLIVSLRDGWRWTHGDVTHVSGFDTIAEVLAALRETTRCECETCRNNRNQSADVTNSKK